jgi:hypothetical protein
MIKPAELGRVCVVHHSTSLEVTVYHSAILANGFSAAGWCLAFMYLWRDIPGLKAGAFFAAVYVATTLMDYFNCTCGEEKPKA